MLSGDLQSSHEPVATHGVPPPKRAALTGAAYPLARA